VVKKEVEYLRTETKKIRASRKKSSKEEHKPAEKDPNSATALLDGIEEGRDGTDSEEEESSEPRRRSSDEIWDQYGRPSMKDKGDQS
jgi:hypothetical protein